MRRVTREPTPAERVGHPWNITRIKPLQPDGSLLWPEHNALDTFRDLWQTGSPPLFLATWMQDPSRLAGDLFRPEWFREFCFEDYVEAVPQENGSVARLTAPELLAEGFVQQVVVPGPRPDLVSLQAHDLALKQTELADFYVRANLLASRQGDVYYIDIKRARLSDLEMIADMAEAGRRHRPRAIGVEANGFQELVLRQARRQHRHLPFVELQPAGRDKVSRARPLADHCERGQVYFLRGAPWMQMVRAELQAFPRGMHDDVPDAMAYGFEMAMKYALGRSWGALVRTQEELHRESRRDLSELFR